MRSCSMVYATLRLLACFGLALMLITPVAAQPAAETAARLPAAPETPPKYRKLAPGVMTTIDPKSHLQVDESFSRHDLVDILSSDPNFAERPWSQGKSPARQTVFRRDIWALEFSFKPVRFVHVDVPTPDGRMEEKLVWYMVYSIKNNTNKPVNFFPEFVLYTKDSHKVYPSRMIPLAVPLIRKREDQNRPLLNTAEIAGKIMPVPKGEETSVWGVVTWEDIDPSTDFFAIYIQGLTNAFEWTDPPGVFQKGDPSGKGREFYYKTLIMDFWRPSDKIEEREEEIRFEGSRWEYGQLTQQGFVAKKPDSAP